MANIVIKDLSESTELDRQAMLAIAGGARFRTGAGSATAGRAGVRRVRLFDLASGSASRQAAPPAPPAPTR